jgi:NAD(P)-dependent dehydrogenase (short-subunit alcohol dehydrogenase family)
MPDQILKGKTCLITGGAGGLGKAIASQFLEAGANVVICDINDERLQQTSTELSPKGPLKAIKTDITNTSEVEALFETLIGAFGKIDVLVNNAGIMDHFDPIGDLDMELWDRVMALNLTAPALLSKFAIRNMLLQENVDGRIINIVSVAGKAGWASGMYSFSFSSRSFHWGWTDLENLKLTIHTIFQERLTQPANMVSLA